MNILSKPILHLIGDVVGGKGIKPGQFNLENPEDGLAGDAYLANFNNLIKTLEQTADFELPKEIIDLGKQLDFTSLDLEKLAELPKPVEEFSELEIEPVVADLPPAPVVVKPAEMSEPSLLTGETEDLASAPPAMFKELNAAFHKLKQAEAVDTIPNQQPVSVEKNAVAGAPVVELPKVATPAAANTKIGNLAEVKATINQAAAKVAVAAEEVTSSQKDPRSAAKVEAPNVSVVSVVKTPAGQVPFLPQVTIKGLPDFVVREITALRFERPDQTSNQNGLTAQNTQRAGRAVELQLVPRSLGVVEVRIVQQNGQLNVSIQTQTAEAANLLKAETNVIKQMLHNAGIVVDEYSVNLNSHLEQSQPTSRSMRDSEGGSQFQNFEANKNGSGESSEFSGSDHDANEQAQVLTPSLAETENEDLGDRTGLYL